MSVKKLMKRQMELEKELIKVTKEISEIRNNCSCENKVYLGKYTDPHGSNYSEYRCNNCLHEWVSR